MIRAVVFDFDGTIMDTESLEFQCWQEIYKSHSCELDMEAWSQCVGTVSEVFHPVTYLEKLSGKKLDRDELMRRHHNRFTSLAQELPLLQGVHEWVQQAKELGLKLGVASSSRTEWVRAHLSRHNLLASFDAIRCAEDVARVKPDPELYLSATKELGVQPSEAVAIEDSPNGLRAAKAAGLRTVSVPNSITYRLPEEKADLRLTSLAGFNLQTALDSLAS
jgi:HAD superfamily hydrolase (TIGR01509 family)